MNLIDKINQKQALIGIIGLGYVGLPLVLRFGEVGFKILGFDSDAQKVESLTAESPISNIFQEQVLPNCGKAGNWKPRPICSGCRNRMFY